MARICARPNPALNDAPCGRQRPLFGSRSPSGCTSLERKESPAAASSGSIGASNARNVAAIDLRELRRGFRCGFFESLVGRRIGRRIVSDGRFALILQDARLSET